MEYLMTYGWAILVIAVVVAIIFQLGIFSGVPSLGTSCLASTGYLCTSPQLYTNGNLVVNVGQFTGQTITLTGIACTPTANAPSTVQSITQTLLPSGGTAALTFSCPISSNTLNTRFSGFIWLQYNTPFETGATSKVGSFEAVASISAGGSSGPSASFVQAASAIANSNSATCSFGSSVKSGDVLVAMYNVYGSGTGTPSISDTQSLSWSEPISDSYIFGDFRNTIAYATAGSSGTESITLTGSGTTYTSMLTCYEVSGATTSGVITSGASGNGGAPANSIVPLISPPLGSIVLGSVSWNNNNNPGITSDTGYTLYPSSPQGSYGSITEYYSNWPGGSTGAGFYFNNLNTLWYEAAIAFPHS
ncbi:MAG: hypothetical protein KGH58_00975 [Candidatus Micrarchaeota archaeon]|nr:hypothetical protein [Candidatus Micrarchaeota archaeon]